MQGLDSGTEHSASSFTKPLDEAAKDELDAAIERAVEKVADRVVVREDVARRVVRETFSDFIEGMLGDVVDRVVEKIGRPANRDDKNTTLAPPQPLFADDLGSNIPRDASPARHDRRRKSTQDLIFPMPSFIAQLFCDDNRRFAYTGALIPDKSALTRMEMDTGVEAHVHSHASNAFVTIRGDDLQRDQALVFMTSYVEAYARAADRCDGAAESVSVEAGKAVPETSSPVEGESTGSMLAATLTSTSLLGGTDRRRGRRRTNLDASVEETDEEEGRDRKRQRRGCENVM